MITGFLLVLTICIAGLYTFKAISLGTEIGNSHREQEKRERLEKSRNTLYIKAVITVLIGLTVSFIQPFGIEKVDAGYTGIKVKLVGSAKGVNDYEYRSGWVVYNSWTEDLLEFPHYQQHIEYDSTVVITKGGFATTITPTFNYALIKGNIGNMFINLRKPIIEVEQGWLKTAIIGAVMDVANKWKVDDIFNEREKFEGAILVEANKRISKWFTISQLRTNIIPPPSLVKAIEEETKAIKNAQTKMQQAKVAVANGQKMIAEAQADSAQRVIASSGKAKAMLIEAKAEAEAIKIKQKEITPVYNDFIRAKNWDGKYPNTMLGSGSNTLFNIK